MITSTNQLNAFKRSYYIEGINPEYYRASKKIKIVERQIEKVQLQFQKLTKRMDHNKILLNRVNREQDLIERMLDLFPEPKSNLECIKEMLQMIKDFFLNLFYRGGYNE